MDHSPAATADRCAELSSLGVRFLLAASPANLERLELRPFGVTLEPLTFLTEDWDADDLLRLWNQMDAYAFGPREMPMPNWVLVDHALMSSGLIMATAEASELPAILERFAVAPGDHAILNLLTADMRARGYQGPVPIAGYCAAPTAAPGRWMGWSMCSAIPRAGLGFIVKALGLEAYRAQVVTGVTQYDNVSLRAHVKFGPARIESAILDLHTAPRSLVYATDLGPWREGRVMDPPGAGPRFLVGASDRERHLELQGIINGGRERLEIVAPGLILDGEEPMVPLRLVPVEPAHA